jgi:D-alanyl-lipoteichoic acid acyltransferase DltB (MBOAT superfamily)
VGSAAARTPGGFAATIVVPTLFTMGLAGIWHGAGLQYVIFGLLHAFYLSANHAWRIFVVSRKPAAARKSGLAVQALCVAVTFVAVLVAQTFFRAHGVGDAMLLLKGMAGLRGVEALESLSHLQGLAPGDAIRLAIGHHMQLALVLLLLAIAWFTPNAHQILGRFSPAMFKVQEAPQAWMRWRPARAGLP